MWIALASMCAAGAALAQTNLIENSGFDVDLANWNNPQSRTAVWNDFDASGSPASGAVLISNVGPGSNTTQLVLDQCVGVNGSTVYNWGGQVRVPSWQPQSVEARIFLITYGSGDCTGDALQIESEGTGRLDEWELESSSLQTDSNAASAKLAIGVYKNTGVDSDVSGLFDNLYLRRGDATGFRIIDEHLSGSWFDPTKPGQGFFLDISPQINLFFGGWFTWTLVPGQYDWMTVQGGFNADVAEVMIYRSSGGVFNDPATVTTSAIGTAQFRFTSCTTGQVSFAMFNARGAATVIPLQRIAPAFNGCVD